MKKWLWFLPLGCFSLLVYFFGKGLNADPRVIPSVQTGKPLPNFALLQLDSEIIMTPAHLKGKVSVLNIWASWCAACVEEQVFLLRLAREGTPLYGLNYKDDKESAKAFLAQYGNPWLMIGSDRQGLTAMDLGVYGAPETFLIDKKGIIRYRHVGLLTPAVWEQTILPLKKQLEAQA